MNSKDRDFKGVWIPKEIWLNNDLDMFEKIIYVEIDGLDNENHCVAGNEYFATFCNCSQSKVTKAIKHLKDLNMIEELEFDGRHRKLRVVKDTIQPRIFYEAASENIRANNIVNNTTITNSISKDISNNTKTQPNFLLNKSKKSNKPTLYSQCMDLIHYKTEDESIRRLLKDWLSMLLEKYRDKNKVLYANVFKGKLNTLDEFDTSKWEEIIKYSLQKGYEAFYPLPVRNNCNSNKFSEGDGLQSESYTKNELQEIEQFAAKMEAEGKQGVF